MSRKTPNDERIQVFGDFVQTDVIGISFISVTFSVSFYLHENNKVSSLLRVTGSSFRNRNFSGYVSFSAEK